MLESKLNELMTDYVKRTYRDKAFLFKVAGGKFQKSGLPDMYLCVNGVHIWMETKVGNNHLQANQIEVIKQMRRAGDNVEIIKSMGGFKKMLAHYEEKHT